MGKRIPFKDSNKHFITVFLTNEEVLEIVEKYPFCINRELAEEYKVSKDLICCIAFHYSLKKDLDTYRITRGWKTNDEPVDLVMFDWFYPKTSNPQLQEIFGKSDHVIRKIAKERNYAVETNKYLAEKVGCKRSTVVSISNYYELSKDDNVVKQRKKDIIIERNKRLGRDVTPELIKQEALKYHSKREFYDRDPSLYATANRIGIMEEVTKHMVNISFSVPQIISRQITEYLFNQKCHYNTRRIIAPYELDVYFPYLKIAFEYDGKGWHQNDEVDKVKLCKEKGILLIKLFERSRKFREDIQNHLIENIEEVNNLCNTIITKENILSFNEPIDFPKLFTEEELYILRNNNLSFLTKNHYNLYQKYKRYNPDNINFKKSHHNKIVWDEEQVINVVNQYSSKGELLKNNYACYQVIHKRFRHLLPLYGISLKRKVMCIETGEIFESISEAGRKLGIRGEAIGRVCRGERKQTHGKTFKFIS